MTAMLLTGEAFTLGLALIAAEGQTPVQTTAPAMAPQGGTTQDQTTQGGTVQSDADLRREIAAERAELQRQRAALDAQVRRLDALERRLGGVAVATANQPGAVVLPSSPPPAPPGSAQASAAPGIQTVGEAPVDQRQIQVAVLAEQGGIITRAGRFTAELDLEYARADRNRVVFRGIEIPASVLIGVFDINESRQDVLTAAGVLRYGVTNRLEINARVPYIYRSDKSVLAPVADPANPNAGQIDDPVSDGGIGDIDFGVRYQLTGGQGGAPYIIAGIQAIAPTGTNPFTVPRDALGNALEAATGSGFWAVSPSLTAILPSDPAVLFGSIGYVHNFGRDIGAQIGPAFVERVEPGGQPTASAGIAISLNPRTSISFGYAHSWAFGTKTTLRSADPRTGLLGDSFTTKSRDLQLGRLLMGVSQRINQRTTVNWNLEVGATDDATDLRTTLRIPFTF